MKQNIGSTRRIDIKKRYSKKKTLERMDKLYKRLDKRYKRKVTSKT